MEYEQIKFRYKTLDPARSADAFEFTSAPADDTTGVTLVDWHRLTRDEAAFKSGPLTDEMPEDLPAGLTVYSEFDFIF